MLRPPSATLGVYFINPYEILYIICAKIPFFYWDKNNLRCICMLISGGQQHNIMLNHTDTLLVFKYIYIYFFLQSRVNVAAMGSSDSLHVNDRSVTFPLNMPSLCSTQLCE